MKKLIIFLAFNSLINCAELNEKAKIKYVKVIKGPHKGLINKIVQLRGTSKEIWGTEDIRAEKFSPIPAIAEYIKTNPPKLGIVYFGHVANKCYCLHEEWLVAIDQDDAQKQFETETE